MPSTDITAVAVIGVGVFGRNHARVYHELAQQGQPVRLVGVVDSDLGRADAVAKEFNCRAFGCIEQLVSTRNEVQAASVAVPTIHHLAVARALMQAGVDVLIEKRFNPAVQAAVPLITKPMFFEVHRLSVFNPRSLDVDVVLDLMIHDLDAVLSFVNSPVKEIRAAGLPILSEKVDIANARIEFESGCVANFTASRVSTERVRKMRFFQPHQYISIDYGRQDLLVFTVGGDHAGTPSVNPEIKVSKPPIAQEEPLRAEIRSFLDSVRKRTQPVIPLEDGRRALAVALEVNARIAEHAGKLQLG